MKIEIKRRLGLLLGIVSVLNLLLMTGCGTKGGSDQSVADYKKTVMGSPLTPAEQASMEAVLRKQQAEAAARQAAAPRGPGAPGK